MEDKAVYTLHKNDGTLEPHFLATRNLDELTRELEEIERKLIPLLISIQHALGKEPSVTTREIRRRG